MTKEIELLPCPFCGSKKIGWSYGGQPATMGYLECYTCDATVSAPSDSATGGSIPFEKLIEKWNTRDYGWEPIETAPKDGTLVDLWIVKDSGMHKSGYQLDGCSFHPRNGYWGKCFVDEYESIDCDHTPTHWRLYKVNPPKGE